MIPYTSIYQVLQVLYTYRILTRRITHIGPSCILVIEHVIFSTSLLRYEFDKITAAKSKLVDSAVRQPLAPRLELHHEQLAFERPGRPHSPGLIGNTAANQTAIWQPQAPAGPMTKASAVSSWPQPRLRYFTSALRDCGPKRCLHDCFASDRARSGAIKLSHPSLVHVEPLRLSRAFTRLGRLEEVSRFASAVSHHLPKSQITNMHLKRVAVFVFAASIFAGPVPEPAADPQLDQINFTDPNSLAAALPTLAAELPGALSAAETPALADISAAISAFAPTAVLSDVPAILSTVVLALESLADAAATRYPLPLPPALASELPAVISEVVPALESDIDAFVTRFPGTISLAALPTVIASELPAIDSQILAEISAEVPVVSSYLTQYASVIASLERAALPTGAAASTGALPSPGGLNATTTGAAGVPPSVTTGALATFTGAASREGWTSGVLGVAGAVAALAML